MGEFINWLVYHLADYWLAHGGLDQFASTQGPIAELSVRKSSLIFTRPAATPFSTRDAFETSAYWALGPDGIFGTDWDDTIYEAVEAAIADWWTAAKPSYSSEITFDSIRWYNAGPEATPPQPVIRVTPVVVAGTGTNVSLPWQDCSTLTLQTGSRKHWGRMYLPNPEVTLMAGTTAQGRFVHAFVDSVVDTWVTAIHPLADGTGVFQCVWSPVSSSILGITAYSADDVPDVQRRRRPASIGYRHVVSSVG